MQDGSIASRYSKLDGQRTAYLTRARTAATLTIPAIFPPQGANGNTDLRTPAQGLGAKLVNTLTAKLLLALLPPNQPFFRLTIDETDLENVSEDSYGELEQKLSDTERMAVRRLDQKAFRPVLEEALRQLIIAGNGLLYIGKDNAKFYRLDKYVVRRDGMGNIRETIICEPITIDDVPRHIKDQVEDARQEGSEEKERYKLYTHITRNGNHWVVQQEINGILDPQSRSTYPLKRLPWVALRMLRTDGDDYGRSYVEQYIGDLKSHEALTKAINEGTTAAARILFMRDPNSTVKLKDLTNAPNGGFVNGRREDIQTLQFEKQADFNTARQRLAEIREELASAFLMNSSITRQAERVTAAEIRMMAQELETVLGGVYSLLGVEFQLPATELLLAELQREKLMPSFPDGVMKPQVLTGIAALGRTQELDKLRLFLEYLEPFGPENMQKAIHPPEYATRVAAALQIETEGLVLTQRERDEEQMEQNSKELMQMVGPQAMDMMKGAPK